MDKNSEEYKEFRRKANERNKKYYSKPEVKARKKIYAKKYRLENKEKISEYGRIIRARPETQERMRKWKSEHKEDIKEYYQKPEVKARKRISDKKYYKKRRSNPEKVRIDIQRQREFRKDNLERVRGYNQKYYTSPKGIINYTHHNHRRLAIIKDRPCDLCDDNIRIMFSRDKVCVYCGSPKKLELDHIIPLKLGGNSLFTNFVIACKKCNTSKSGRDVFYWCKLKGMEVPKIVLELLEKQKG